MPKKHLSLNLGFFSGLLLTACGRTSDALPQISPTPAAAQPRSVVIDTDMAADDWMAILFLLQRPEVRIEAISVTGAGMAHCESGIRNASGLVALTGRKPIPIACGRDMPLQGGHAFPASWRQDADNLFGLSLPEGSNTGSSQNAVELLTSVIQASPQKVVLLALGPLTNVAEALQDTPSLAAHLEMIYVMGGAIDVPGNIAASDVGIENSLAEWNIYADPYAANVVLHSGAPVTLVPLDATNHTPVTTSFYGRIKNDHSSAAATFVFDVLTVIYDSIESGEYYFWDPLAAAILTDEGLASFETRGIRVIEEEGPASGRALLAEDGVNVRVAVTADGERFEQVFLDALNNPAP